MDKVAGFYTAPVNVSLSSQPMSANIRGHHSSINKAVSAHRQISEDRSNRQSYRKLDATVPALNFAEEAQMPSTAQEIDTFSESDLNSFIEHEYIDPASGPAKQAIVQSFQTSEPGRPLVGEPMPKGSYLDVEA